MLDREDETPLEALQGAIEEKIETSKENLKSEVLEVKTLLTEMADSMK